MAVKFLVLDSKVCKKYVIFGQSSKFEWPNLISNLEGTLASNKEKSDSLEFSFFFPFYVPFRARDLYIAIKITPGHWLSF